MSRRGKNLFIGFWVASKIVSRPGYTYGFPGSSYPGSSYEHLTCGITGGSEGQYAKLRTVIEKFVNILGGRINFLIEGKRSWVIAPILNEYRPIIFISSPPKVPNYMKDLMEAIKDDGTPVFEPRHVNMNCSCCKHTHE